ncbi:hypothetical protein PTSG_09833 [Salpingoeca rosetta]|uniref:BZIP domain-containing protein n=1 Tax=Salpingoeca rosetta (strain ATCC 50818 / BSB-021) TaxID=946362 RepID=F2UNA1_SALR5|nr:uncharacterized protein PTSG_09833 [Salpingoeca rosetta]EGD79106.1 hypothetical protein PTSG_09833 [Salpingoeca rosetta]|eukprot:XP_004989191.1 hypothetical protein PTSG_09833 [Salpingoeca rosetta]
MAQSNDMTGDSFLMGHFPNPQIAPPATLSDEKLLQDVLGLAAPPDPAFDSFLLDAFSKGTAQQDASLLPPPTLSDEMLNYLPATGTYAAQPDASASSSPAVSAAVHAAVPAKEEPVIPAEPSKKATKAKQSKKKRASSWGSRTADGRRRRKEPKRADYATTEEYLADWSRWRRIRDSNNRSVKRSREKARERSQQIEAQNNGLQQQIDQLADELKEAKQLAFKAFMSRESLLPSEVDRIASFADSA